MRALPRQITGAVALGVCALAAGCGGSSSDHAATQQATTAAAGNPALPAALQGTWTRKLTQADIDRTSSFRNEGGPGQSAPRPAPQQLVIQPSDLQVTDLKAHFTIDQDFKASANGKLAILGYQHPERGAACGPQIPQNADYTWKVANGKLVLRAAKDPCADRDSVLSGTWKRG